MKNIDFRRVGEELADYRKKYGVKIDHILRAKASKQSPLRYGSGNNRYIPTLSSIRENNLELLRLYRYYEKGKLDLTIDFEIGRAA